MARALLHHAALPLKFWGESVLMATQVINKLLTSLFDWKCPLHVLTNHMSDYTQLRVFGCLYFAINTNPHKRKFEPRANKCIFLGYLPNCKGFKVYDLSTHKVNVYRDVTFYEDVFPYKESSLHEKDILPLPMAINDPSSNDITPTTPLDQDGQTDNLPDESIADDHPESEPSNEPPPSIVP